LLDEIPSWPQSEWLLFSKTKITDTIKNAVVHLLQNLIIFHGIISRVWWPAPNVLLIFINIANLCINLSYWPVHLKKFTLIIISKPNKPTYNSPKIFHPIILLNTLGKLNDKAISERLQIHSITSNFIHPNQSGGIKQYSTLDASLYLTYLIWVDRLKVYIQAC